MMSESIYSVVSHELVITDERYDVRLLCSKDTGSYVSSHWHLELELIYLLSGELEVVLEQKSYPLSANDLILINSKSVHSTTCTKGNEAILLQLPYPIIEKYNPDLTSASFDLQLQNQTSEALARREKLKTLLRRLYQIQQDPPKEAFLLFQLALLELLYLLFHDFQSPKSSDADKKQSKNPTLLEPILAYVNLHYQESISIAQIAAVVSFQPEYFCRFFKKNMGITFLHYLNEVRISHIYEDLLHTDIPVNKLLELHGFTNYKLFRRMFREKFGSTPRAIRASRLLPNPLLN